MKTLRISIAAILAVSGWILSDAARAETGVEVPKAAVDQVLATTPKEGNT